MSSNTLIELFHGDICNTLSIDENVLRENPQESFDFIMDEAHKLAEGTVQICYKAAGIILSPNALPLMLEMCREEQGDNPNQALLLRLEVQRVEDIFWPLSGSEQSHISDFVSEKSDGSWEFAEPAREARDELVDHCMAVLTTQLHGCDSRVVLPELAHALLNSLANHGITSAPDGLFKLCDGDISDVKKCVHDCVLFASALPVPVRDSIVAEMQYVQTVVSQPPAMQEEVHVNVICDGCNMDPIVGKRFTSMRQKDYDLCEKCIESRNPSYYEQVYGTFRPIAMTNRSFESSEVLSCEALNSCANPGDLEGPMVDMLKNEYKMKGAFLVGQFREDALAKVLLCNPSKGEIHNAALRCCYGPGMGFAGMDLGTIGPGEFFEVVLDLHPDEKGMSCWALTSDDVPMGSLLCAVAC